MIPSLELWPTKAKETSPSHEVRLTPLDTNRVFQCLGDEYPWQSMNRDENQMKYEIKRKYEIMNVKVEVN